MTATGRYADLNARDRMIVALDLPGVDEARQLVDRLGDSVSFYKIGFQLVLSGGLELVRQLKQEDKQVFLDMKLLDIDATVEKAVANAARLGIDMLTIHADQMLTIGIVSEVRQPVVIKTTLRNVPEEAIFGWDPGAQFGMHRMDEFWLDRPVEGRLPMGQNGQG